MSLPNFAALEDAALAQVELHRLAMEAAYEAGNEPRPIPMQEVSAELSLKGAAHVYSGPLGRGVVALFEHRDAEGVRWFRRINFGPQTDLDLGWVQERAAY